MAVSKIGVVVPIYNMEKLLSRCVDSVLNQTFHDFTLVLVDDCAKDSSPKICDDYARKDNRVVALHSKINRGTSMSRNIGLEYVLEHNIKYVFNLDSDDFIHERTLETLYNIAEKENADIVACTFKKFTEPSEITPIPESDYEYEIFTDMENFWCDKLKCVPFCTARLFKTELWKDIRFPESGLDDERTTYKIVLNSKRVATLPAAFYNYFTNPTSYMNSNFSLEKKKDQAESIYENFPYLYEHGYKKTFLYRVGNYYFQTVSYIVNFGSKIEFANLIESMKENVFKLVIDYPDYLPYDNAKKIYHDHVLGFLSFGYKHTKGERKGLLQKLRAIKWYIKTRYKLLHKHKIFTRKNKKLYLEAIKEKKI